MLGDILKQFMWLDIFVLILLLRISYSAIKKGLVIEFFKFVGTIFSIYLSLHYYTTLSKLIVRHLGFIKENFFVRFMDLFSFLALAILGYLIFLLLRAIFYRFIKVEASARLSKCAGFGLGLIRVYFLMGLIVFIFVVSGISYLKKSVTVSYSGKHLFKVAPYTYCWLWNNFSSKFAQKQNFNFSVLEAQKDFSEK